MNYAIFLPLLLAALPAFAGFVQHVPVDVEDSRRNFPLRVARGEVVDLSVDFLDGGAPLDISGSEVVLHTRTNGMDAALSWVTPGTATNNAACFVLDVDAVLPIAAAEWSVVVRQDGRELARAGGSAFVRGTAAGTAAAEPASVLADYATTGYVDRAVASIDIPPADLTPATNYVDAALSDYARTNGLLRVEEDPTVPAWAKAPLPPTNGFLRVESDPVFAAWAGGPDGTNGLAELAAEVSANSALLGDHGGRLDEAEQYIQDVANQIPDLYNYAGDINTGGNISAGTMDIQGVRVATADDLSDYATYDELGTAAFADASAFATRADEQLLAQLVMGSNVVFEVTNYNSRAHAPAARILQLSESNEYFQVWAETNGLARTLAAATAYADSLAPNYAPRAWSGTTSGMGAEAPAGTTWISTPTTVVAGGHEYTKVVHAGGEAWVLCATDAALAPASNGFFRVETADGEPLVSIERTESVLVGVDAAGISVQGNAVTIPVPVVSQDPPVCYAAQALVNPTWADLSESTPAWIDSAACTGASGAWVWTIETDAQQAFFQFRVLQPGATVIRNHGWTDLSGGIIVNGVRYAPSASGDTLTFTRVSGQ